MAKSLNAALIGAGRIGQIHAKNLFQHPHCHLAFVADPYRPAAEKISSETGAEIISLDDIFSNDSIDLVLICSSTDTHADLLERCAQSGKAMFCEKPIDLEYTRAKDAVDMINQSNTHCSLGFNRRHDPMFNQLKNKLHSGDIGALELLVITSRDPSPPPVEYIKVSGGLFRDMSIHDLDIARWLLNEELSEIYAVGSCLVDPAIAGAGDIDTAMITIKTTSGKLCHINNSRRSVYGYDQRIEAFGAQGMLQAHNNRTTNLEHSTASGCALEKPLDFFLERYAEAYKLQLNDFVNSVIESRAPVATANDGLEALRLADAAIESYTTGRPVSLTQQ